MQFVVRALDDAQQVQTLVLEAVDEPDARRLLQSRRLTALSVRARSGLLGSRRSRFPLSLFAQELHSLLSAGLSVLESLEALLERESQPARRPVIERLVQRLREGQRLSAAMAQQPDAFPPLFVGIVQAAEGTSDLPGALARYLRYEARAQAVRHKVVSAAIYPVILLGVGGLVTCFLLGYVVPRFAAVYQGSGRSLPTASQWLLAWGEFASAHTGALAAALAAMLVGGFCAVRHQVRARGWHTVLGVIPGAGDKLRVGMLARLYLTLGTLLDGGIALHRALALASAVVPAGMAATLASVRADVESGQPLSQALERRGLGTPVALRLLRVGEQSGQLGAMLANAATFHDEEISRWIDRFSRAFEPVLMTAIGLVIGLIVILLYMPIFDLAGSLQ